MKKASIIILTFCFMFTAQSVLAQKQSGSKIKPAPRTLVSLIKTHLKAIKEKDVSTLKRTMLSDFPAKGFNIGMPPTYLDSTFVMKAYDLNPNDLAVFVRSSKKYPKVATSIAIKPGTEAYKALKMAGKNPDYYMMFHIKNQSGYKIALSN